MSDSAPIRYHLSAEHLLAFERLHFRSSFPGFFAAMAALIAAPPLYFWWTGERTIALGMAAIMSAMLLIMLAVHYFAVLPWRARRSYRYTPSLREEICFSYNADGFSIEQTSSHVSTSWSDVLRWRGNKHIFALYVAPNLAHVIPKSVMDSAQSEQFSHLLGNSISKPYHPQAQ